jgi:hypothetical protein
LFSFYLIKLKVYYIIGILRGDFDDQENRGEALELTQHCLELWFRLSVFSWRNTNSVDKLFELGIFRYNFINSMDWLIDRHSSNNRSNPYHINKNRNQ